MTKSIAYNVHPHLSPPPSRGRRQMRVIFPSGGRKLDWEILTSKGGDWVRKSSLEGEETKEELISTSRGSKRDNS